MIRINSFVIERAVDFITILEEDFPRQCYTIFIFYICVCVSVSNVR